ncbi:Tfp pilus assembly protein PilF [Dolichospermum sp. ST_con]|nr:Tfp pilus assembly protein PilF [Dolichospermum sp. ST_con]MDD1419991.1 Tfp pilus assembly protein PilF [Dolichospermum sp. ST_sed1]MDD1423131.1 Tfp pilus assembly protein PilF [Dolichospermum sp. ST_sed9]MDD1429565.1 Tfp pilus assembly protein PilF [Dolichospermum sp. ST_sed6]MDD1435046.1 Tfp pilus assembly protein PilF [Dolichospermum sp. ST_sed10]MDD1438865.1 Tfp pilus assembly protein PilF [Dolichospermum sp. ST_sed3]MDD1445011.1 Tfp pilus assembly protein PilF [Dolichospermum sp. ST_s
MSESRNRWIVRVVLAFAVVAFLGVSIIPILTAINKPESSPQNQPATDNKISSSNQKSKLEDQVRGYELVLQKDAENQTALKGLLQARLELLRQKSQGEVKPADIQAVIEPLEKLAKLNPQKSKYGVLLAQAKQQIGDKEGSAQTYRTILTTKPGDLKALQGMVNLQLSEKRPEAAIGLLQESLAAATQANTIQPGSVDIVAVQVLLGSVYAFQKNDTQAIYAYDQAIKKDPQDFRPVLAKAMLFKQQGKVDEAKPLFDSATALAPAQYKDEINKAAAAPTATPTSSFSPTPSPTATP